MKDLPKQTKTMKQSEYVKQQTEKLEQSETMKQQWNKNILLYRRPKHWENLKQTLFFCNTLTNFSDPSHIYKHHLRVKYV